MKSFGWRHSQKAFTKMFAKIFQAKWLRKMFWRELFHVIMINLQCVTCVIYSGGPEGKCSRNAIMCSTSVCVGAFSFGNEILMNYLCVKLSSNRLGHSLDIKCSWILFGYSWMLLDKINVSSAWSLLLLVILRNL